MADIKDISQAIHSALEEIGVNGQLNVAMDGDEATAPIGRQSGDDLAVAVHVSELPAEPAPPRP